MNLGTKVKLNRTSEHYRQFSGVGVIIGINDNEDGYNYEVEVEDPHYINNYRESDLIAVGGLETPTTKTMNGVEYQKVVKVGDKVKVKTSDSGSFITGCVGEINNQMCFYLFNNTISGSMGKIHPTTKEYRYSWACRFEAQTEVEIITNAEANEKPKEKKLPTKKKKVYLTLEKENGKVIMSMRLPEEIENFFKTASKENIKESSAWFYANGKPAQFYEQPATLNKQLLEIDDGVYSDYGTGLVSGARINVALIRTLGVSKTIKITCNDFGCISNIELQNYVRKLGLYIKKLWESNISKTKIKSIITYEI